ncbi:MAG: tyrosine-type recombinase/integrase [Candidatus Diapherotrites archaeon]|nr:tyrosine-type recombinase/integrase [Candidatus Diapherotrites archaeon]
MRTDPYNTGTKLVNCLERVRQSLDLCKANKRLILEFHAEAVARGLSEKRCLKYVSTLRNLGTQLGKPFNKADKHDIIRLLSWLESTAYKEWTKHDYKVILKSFYKWLNGGEEYPKVVSWVKTGMKNGNHMLPEELLTEEDVRALVEACTNPRDKAFVLTLYESGCRISELLTLQVKSVRFDEHGSILRVTGKTGDRRVRVISAAPAIALWLDNHPTRKGHLFCSLDGTGINYSTANVLLRRLAKKAGITKRVNPHGFRHARATSLANKLTEAQMKEFFGWAQSSEMAAVYVHLLGRDVDDALLSIYGVKPPEDARKERFVPRACPRCKETNSPASKYCCRCGSALDLATALEADDKHKEADALMNELIKDDRIKALLLERLVAIQAENH